MNCPLCHDRALVAHHRGGVEIDVCAHCKGVWLDRGELEKLLDGRSPSAPPTLDDGPTGSLSGTGHAASGRAGKGDKPKKTKSKKKQRKKNFGERLGDVLEDVLDF